MSATYRVQHLNELGEVVKPACCCHLEGIKHISVSAIHHDRVRLQVSTAQSAAAPYPHTLW